MSKMGPYGHIPLNEETMRGMNNTERAFWEEFLPEVMAVVEKEQARDTPLPYDFPLELLQKFQTAIDVYGGDKYCQISQIREMFSFASIQ
ncbi:MAG: hypothetical protein WC724_03155 [Candidatus Paceibacterota bacterium]|jgi:hypothetical protein